VQLLGRSRCGSSTVWGRFLLHGTHQRRLDGSSFSEWHRRLHQGMSGGESRERRVVQWGVTRMLLNKDLVMIRPHGAQGWRCDRAATSDTGGIECAVIGNDGVAHARAHSDRGEGSRWVLGHWLEAQPDFKNFQYSKSYKTCKIEYTALQRSKNIQTWHEAPFE
jgi:hypothetical protein